MIKGVGRINKWINTKLADGYKKQFAKIIPTVNYSKREKVDITLYSISGRWHFDEQLLSIFSFLKNVGEPVKWTIISDGSHTKEQKYYFEKFSFIELANWKCIIAKEYIDFVTENECWQYKKLFSYVSIKINSPTLLLDSDILFFKNFKSNFDNLSAGNWYFTDLNPFFEDGFIHEHCKRYINSGLLILNSDINWQKGVNYILNRKNIPVQHFTEQTAIWLVVKDNKMRYVDPNEFYTETKDHFTFKNTVNHSTIALRHFPGPIRFRLWLAGKEFNYFLLSGQ